MPLSCGQQRFHPPYPKPEGGETMAKNSVRTSSKVASKASKVLRSPSTSKTAKQIAGSTLSNRRPK